MAEDREFKAMLTKRIRSYAEHEVRLRERIEELMQEQASVARRRASAEQLYEEEFGVKYADADADPRLFEQPVERIGPLTGLSWAEAMTRVLEEAGEPLHVAQIWERLREGGFRTEARDPVRSVVAIAVRDPKNFPKAGPNRYGLQPSLLGPSREMEGGQPLDQADSVVQTTEAGRPD